MTTTATRLLAFAGSLREGSYNRRLVPVLAESQALARVSAAAQVSA